jgi:hypothetical protein
MRLILGPGYLNIMMAIRLLVSACDGKLALKAVTVRWTVL